MRRSPTIVTLVSMVFVALLAAAPLATAAGSPVGTYKKAKGKGEKDAVEITVKIEEWGPGKAKLTWMLKGPGVDGMSMSLVSALDGKDAPLIVNGKPSGETMAIKLIDKLHSSTILKMNGQLFGTSKATFSSDFKTMTVENDVSTPVPGNPSGKTTEVWIRQ